MISVSDAEMIYQDQDQDTKTCLKTVLRQDSVLRLNNPAGFYVEQETVVFY